jgi:hypothetical protein
MIILSAVEWLQSFQGVTTLSIGGLSLGSIVGLGIYIWRSAGKMKGVKDLVEIVKESKVMIDEEREQVKLYKEANAQKDFEIAKQTQVNNLLLKGMSIIIAASGGIDSVSKIEMVNDMKNAKDILTKEFIETGKETVEKVKEEVKDKTVKVLDSAIIQAATLIDKYSKK